MGLVSVAGRLFGWPGARLLRRQRQIPDPALTVAERIAEGRKRRLDAHGYERTTEDQDMTIYKAFADSVDQDAVCALAARVHGGGVPCRVVDKSRGGFNLCFFVEFDDARAGHEGRDEEVVDKDEAGKVTPTKWVVRLPIGHAVDRPWDKVVSEVATMRYLAQKTRIPVSRVHAFGRDATLIRKPQIDDADEEDPENGQVYLILDFVPGAVLDEKVLAAAKREQRLAFCTQLVDVLAELRALEFSQIGSLVPGPVSTDDDASVVIGPLLSISDNILCLPPPPIWTSTSTSVTDFMQHTYEAVIEFFYAPVTRLPLEKLRRELFALDALKPIFLDAVFNSNTASSTSGAECPYPFVLNHLDLRATNIVVDEELRIQGVIDWEFTGTVPLPLFTPPSWVVGHDAEVKDSTVHFEFRQALCARAREVSSCAQLQREWYGDSEATSDVPASTRRRFCIAHIMRKPAQAVQVFDKFLDTAAAPEKKKDARLATFFANHPELEAEAQRRSDQSREYSAYLAENGIYETQMDRFYAMKKQIEDKLGRPLY